MLEVLPSETNCGLPFTVLLAISHTNAAEHPNDAFWSITASKFCLDLLRLLTCEVSHVPAGEPVLLSISLST